MFCGDLLLSSDPSALWWLGIAPDTFATNSFLMLSLSKCLVMTGAEVGEGMTVEDSKAKKSVCILK